MWEAASGSIRRAGGESSVKRWLSPWVLPFVMLGVVVLVSRPVAGVVWLVVSFVLVRVLNGRFERLANDEPLRRYFDDPKHSYLGAPEPRYSRTPS
jgi:hypothetical protein